MLDYISIKVNSSVKCLQMTINCTLSSRPHGIKIQFYKAKASQRISFLKQAVSFLPWKVFNTEYNKFLPNSIIGYPTHRTGVTLTEVGVTILWITIHHRITQNNLWLTETVCTDLITQRQHHSRVFESENDTAHGHQISSVDHLQTLESLPNFNLRGAS